MIHVAIRIRNTLAEKATKKAEQMWKCLNVKAY